MGHGFLLKKNENLFFKTPLKSAFPALARPDADGVLQGQNEEFPVSNAPGTDRIQEQFHNLFYFLVREGDLDSHPWLILDLVIRPLDRLDLDLLVPITRTVRKGDPPDPRFPEDFLHLVDFFRWNDEHQEFHKALLYGFSAEPVLTSKAPRIKEKPALLQARPI